MYNKRGEERGKKKKYGIHTFLKEREKVAPKEKEKAQTLSRQI